MLNRRVLVRLLPALAVGGVLAVSILASPAQILATLSGYGYSYNGHLASGPAATSAAATREDVFVAGVDNAAWTATLTMPGGTFSGWSSLGGSIQHDPTA